MLFYENNELTTIYAGHHKIKCCGEGKPDKVFKIPVSSHFVSFNLFPPFFALYERHHFFVNHFVLILFLNILFLLLVVIFWKVTYRLLKNVSLGGGRKRNFLNYLKINSSF